MSPETTARPARTEGRRNDEERRLRRARQPFWWDVAGGVLLGGCVLVGLVDAGWARALPFAALVSGSSWIVGSRGGAGAILAAIWDPSARGVLALWWVTSLVVVGAALALDLGAGHRWIWWVAGPLLGAELVVLGRRLAHRYAAAPSSRTG